MIEEHVSANYQKTVKFIREEQILGTAGAVFNALNLSEYSTVIIVPADTLFPFSLIPEILENHRPQNKSITWVVTTIPGENAQNPGKVLVDPFSKSVVHTFLAKIKNRKIFSYYRQTHFAITVGLENQDQGIPPQCLSSFRYAKSF